MRGRIYCSTARCRSCRGASFLHKLGIALMVIGALILLLCVPFEVWLALLGLVLILLGFVLFRLG